MTLANHWGFEETKGVIEITKENYPQFKEKYQQYFAMFYTDGCPECDARLSMLEELNNQMKKDKNGVPVVIINDKTLPELL